jgi:hypothetical protein
MPRLAVLLTFVATLMLSSAVVLDAQRGGGRGEGAAGGRGGGGRAGGMVPPPTGRDGGAGRGGFRIQRRINMPPALPSINRPSFPIDGLNRPAFPLSGPLGFRRAQPSPFDARRGAYTRLQPFVGTPYGYAYGSGYDLPYAPESTYEKLYRTPTPEPVVTEGMLLLDVTPATAHVIVDSAYVGNVEDLRTDGLTLGGGRHWVDFEAPNYDRKTVEVTIRPGEPLRYRFDMTPERRVQTIAPPAAPPQTMYMIAGCYAGNRPPVAANLPNGCDIRSVRVIRPPTRSN